MKILALKFLKKIKFWGLYVYVEESFDDIFNMGYGRGGGGGVQWGYGVWVGKIAHGLEG